MSPVVEERLAEIEQLCREHHVERLELFGSAASGAFRPGESDLDFLVTFEAGAPTGLALASALEDLFGIHVDLVEERAIRNPVLSPGGGHRPQSGALQVADCAETPRPRHTPPRSGVLTLGTANEEISL